MTSLLERAFKEAAALSEDEQDTVAQIVLDTIHDEQHWDRQFAKSHDMLDFLAEKALVEYQAGHTKEVLA